MLLAARTQMPTCLSRCQSRSDSRPLGRSRKSPAAGRRVIEGTHLLGEEAGTVGSTRRARVVTTRQTPAVARLAIASAARSRVAEARHDLDVSAELDEARNYGKAGVELLLLTDAEVRPEPAVRSAADRPHVRSVHPVVAREAAGRFRKRRERAFLCDCAFFTKEKDAGCSAMATSSEAARGRQVAQSSSAVRRGGGLVLMAEQEHGPVLG
jgi:hypothetical protein